MPKSNETPLQRLAFKRLLSRWTKLADEADALDPHQLRQAGARARQLQKPLDEVLHKAEYKLTLPVIGSNAIQAPIGADWSWRPEIWRGPVRPVGAASVPTKTRIGSEATVFHDCTISELTFRQLRNTRPVDLAPFGLRMDVFGFDGSFLSLAIDLPAEATHDLRKRHVIGLDAIVEMEKPLDLFARLNIKHGPNTEQVVRELPVNNGEAVMEFDIAYTKVNERRVERAWVDLILKEPEMNQVVLRDLTFSRRLRSEL